MKVKMKTKSGAAKRFKNSERLQAQASKQKPHFDQEIS